MLPRFVPDLVALLRRRGVPLGVDDVTTLRTALAAGFGWSSRGALEELCVALWATSVAEAEVIRAAVATVGVPDWDVADDPPGPVTADTPGGGPDGPPPLPRAEAAADTGDGTPVVQPQRSPPAGSTPLPHSGWDDPTLLLVPRYPVTPRQVAQTWRRMRRPARRGPAVELDVDETVRRRAHSGVVVPPVLVPTRRNIARLLLLVDTGGSMLPYRDFVDQVVLSVGRAARLELLTVRYFHNVPGHADRAVLTGADARTPDIDRVLDDVPPLRSGRVYRDPGLTVPEELSDGVSAVGRSGAVCVISDAGAARSRLDTIRLLDTVALLKALRNPARTVAWLNPVPRSRWPRTTAALVARHVPMHPLTVPGMYAAVDVLRGRYAPTAKPL